MLLILCATLSGYFNISIDPPFMMYLPLKLRNENLKSNSLTLFTNKNKKENLDLSQNCISFSLPYLP